MSHILLLAAGFSCNWQGWLASEITSGLLSRLGNDAALHARVQKAESFEDALSSLQLEAVNASPTDTRKRQLADLQHAISETFASMNRGFAKLGTMEFCSTRQYLIAEYLARFDAIFTLNQDLLLDLYYPRDLMGSRWNGWEYPGMVPVHDPSGSTDVLSLRLKPNTSFSLSGNLQPIFKLHGATNWIDADGGDLMVMGADKASTIAAKAILRWNFEQFERYLSAPDTRIMIIGYGFRDGHVNAALTDATQKHGLKTFIVHPDGRLILKKVNRTYTHGAIYCPEPIEDLVICGESTRWLNLTFGGKAHAEWESFDRFLSQ